MRDMKKYILRKFRYKELGMNFTQKMKKATRELTISSIGYRDTGLLYRGYIIYIKPSQSYLFFFVKNEETSIITVLRVLHDGMEWESILKKWLKKM